MIFQLIFHDVFQNLRTNLFFKEENFIHPLPHILVITASKRSKNSESHAIFTNLR